MAAKIVYEWHDYGHAYLACDDGSITETGIYREDEPQTGRAGRVLHDEQDYGAGAVIAHLVQALKAVAIVRAFAEPEVASAEMERRANEALAVRIVDGEVSDA